jgi:hypothetical protein
MNKQKIKELSNKSAQKSLAAPLANSPGIKTGIFRPSDYYFSSNGLRSSKVVTNETCMSV